jgi:hypothetical protein
LEQSMSFHTRLNWYPRLEAIALALCVLTATAAQGTPVVDASSETEEIMTTMIPLAKQMLEKHGTFAPYGGAMTTNGKVVTVVGYSGTELPPSQEIITALNAAFRAGAAAGQYKATGLFSDVEVVPPSSAEKTHAIAAALDHDDNYSVVIYFPYKIVAGTVQFDEVFASPGEGKVFQK